MIRIAIVEDEKYDAELLQSYLRKYQKEQGETFQISLFTDGYDIADKYRPEYDIVLMDIEMSLMDGMETAKRIREADPQVILIFTTSNPQYAIQGYQVQALDYLLKPISYESLSYVLQKAIIAVKKNEKEVWISISTRDGTVKINASELLYVESRNHTLSFHTDVEVWKTTVFTLTEIEEKLKSAGFFRPSRWLLVNVRKVRAVQNGIVTIGDERFPISKSKASDLMMAIIELAG